VVAATRDQVVKEFVEELTLIDARTRTASRQQTR
jgi:hypothetical protein